MKLVIFAILFFTFQISRAQDSALSTTPQTPAAQAPVNSSVTETPVARTVATQTNWLIGASFVQWNEPLHLSQGSSYDTDTANFSGFGVQAFYETNYAYWGWNVEGLLGSARASGGNNSAVVTYSETGRPCTFISAIPELFYRPSERISMGLGLPLFLRSVSWPSQGTASAQAAHSFDIGLNLNASLRLTSHWEVYQSIGALAPASSTLWQVGINYRLE